jgi:hypothetical protein
VPRLDCRHASWAARLAAGDRERDFSLLFFELFVLHEACAWL